MNSSENKQWYLIQCKVRHELRAQENLQRQGYHCFLPLYSIEKIRAGKRSDVIEPLFPGYLFIALNREGENWAPIRSTRGVLRLVTFAGIPAVVPFGVVEQLMAAKQDDDLAAPVLKPGDVLRITEGPFKELEAVFHSFNGEARAFVLLDIMQKQQKLSMQVKDLKAL
ncbi:transcription/translation regulatory transformer protein RfaH [Amphritea opalescens]|uniref:transcription/translation regulatory transformer protein RfaH n=1 Tax=Amphritea opalescens TaxID=2490544 RepID=UPI00240794C0|nr:transcription/translation regulatory transformer protein RfaH [Amphritea opalescens]